MKGLNIFLVFVLALLSSITHSSGTNATSSLSSLLNKSNNDASLQAEQVEFLKVDEAFIFSSETQANGIHLKWKIADEYYLYKERFKFRITDESIKSKVELGEPKYSTTGKAKEDPYFGLVHVIHNAVEVNLPVTLKDGLREAEIKVSYQGCAEAGLCYPPKHQKILFVLPEFDKAAKSTNTESGNSKQFSSSKTPPQSKLDNASSVFSFIETSSLASIVGIFFLLGIGLTFTPCVFPMIPIITSIIAGQEKPTVSKSLLLSLSYVLGMAITYAAAGVVTGLLGAGANVQAALQDPILIGIFASLFLLLSLAMFGFYELQLPAFLRDRLNTTSQNLSGGHLVSVFFIGALSALVVSPCVSAPLAGALLYISVTGDAVIGGTSLFALGLGMGVPLILIAVGGGKFLPKAGQWMDTIKQVFGAMLVAVAIWLINRVISDAYGMILWAVFLGITASHMGAFDSANKGWPRFFKGIGLLIAFYAAALLIGALSGATDPLKPLARIPTSNIQSLGPQTDKKTNFVTIYTIEELNSELSVAKNLGKPTLVDFYADWCISCKVMESQVFPLPDIAELMAQFHLVKVDVTDNTKAQQLFMENFGLFGPPSILFFDKEMTEIKTSRIVGEISKESYKSVLSKALEPSA